MKTFERYIKGIYNKRSTSDRRKKVDWYLIEYKDTAGIPYRKSFEFPVKTSFKEVKKNIPLTIK